MSFELRTQLSQTPPDDLENRRQHPRLPSPPVHVSGVDQVRDVSAGGMCVTLFAPRGAGEQDELILTDANCYYTRSLRAEVVWARGKLAGLRWVDPSEEELAWLNVRLGEWGKAEETVWVEPVKTKNTVWRA